MNYFLLGAGLFALATTVGHFVAGAPKFLDPMLKADLDKVAKKVMHCVFHYMSVFLVTATAVLWIAGLEIKFPVDLTSAIVFIVLNCAGFAIVQLTIAVTSGLKRPVFKLFQWIFFGAIAVLGALGVACG